MKEEGRRLIQESQDEDAPCEPTRALVLGGYVATFFSTVAFAASGGFSQALGGYVPTFELNLWRFGTQSLLAGIIIVVLKLDVRIPKDKIPWLLLLCFAYNAHNSTFYESSIYLPVTEMICLNNVLPLPIAFVLTILLYKRWSCCEVLAIGVCITGVLLVTQPQKLFPGSPPLQAPTALCPKNLGDVPADLPVNFSNTNTNVTGFINASVPVENSSMGQPTEEETQPASNELLGDLLAGGSAVFLVIRVFTTNKKLRGFNPIVVAFWVATSGVVVSSILMLALETPTYPPDSTCQIMLFGHAFTATFAALLATVGELNIPPTMFALILASETLILLGAQYTVLKGINPGRGNILEIIGAILVFMGTVAGPIYSMFKEYRDSDGTVV